MVTIRSMIPGLRETAIQFPVNLLITQKIQKKNH